MGPRLRKRVGPGAAELAAPPPEAFSAALAVGDEGSAGAGDGEQGDQTNHRKALVSRLSEARGSGDARRLGLVGLGRIHDLKFEQWFAIWKADRDWPKVALFAAPTLSPHGDRASAKAKAGKRPKKETRAEKAAALEADAEAEA